ADFPHTLFYRFLAGLGVFDGAGQRFESTAMIDGVELSQERIMNQAVARQSLTAVALEGTAIKSRNPAAGLFDDQHAGSGIPGIEIELPEAVELSRRHATQVEGGGTSAPHAVRAQSDLVIEVNVGILMAFVAGKAGSHQAFRQVPRRGNVDALSVHKGPATLLGSKQVVARGIVDDSRYALAFVFQGQRHTKNRVSVCKIGGAVKRVNVPSIVAAGFNAGAFLSNHIVMRPALANALQDKSFGVAVRFSHKVDVTLVFDLDSLGEVARQQLAGFASDSLGSRNKLESTKRVWHGTRGNMRRVTGTLRA